ncbi:hypothetical protein GP486_000515 [Trichoglossum hirsutum]|uniref:LGFP repeat-containing protein n=1 Tax=Trichoglossum hirsutum TaxID=265104 RepID=A0A9P8LIE2_9PEZI|nr:hypothetical protein GP486_000515 [Trichoglossum hirsutum]
MATQAIQAKYASLGGAKSPLGTPQSQLVQDGNSGFSHIKYTNGAIYWSASSGASAIYGDIYKKWISSSNMGYPITDEQSTKDNVCRFNNFSGGGAIYWTLANGAHLIYGGIYQKWMASGGEAVFSYPITDEASTPDNVCRFNNFNNGGAIYWTSAHGAFLVYGEIYKKWQSLGGEGGYLGYPMTDETSAGAHGGRYNDFNGGSIYWSPAHGAHDHAGPLPDHLDFDNNYVFPDGVAAGGNTHLRLSSSGDMQFSGHFHDSGAVDYDYAVAIVLTDADNQAYSSTQQGKISGTTGVLFGGSRDSDWNLTANNPAVASSWRAIVAQYSVTAQSKVNIDIKSLLDEVMSIIEKAGPIVGAVVALF